MPDNDIVLAVQQHVVKVNTKLHDLREKLPEQDKLLYLHVVLPGGDCNKYLGVFSNLVTKAYVDDHYIFNLLNFTRQKIDWHKFCLEKTPPKTPRIQYYWQYASIH